MEAVCKGVSDAEVSVVGILPDSDTTGINRYVQFSVGTSAGQGRNVIIANSVHGAIAIDGAYGTLSEIAHTLPEDKPVVTLGSLNIRGVNQVKTPEEAVRTIMELV
ncbi:MAG: TIGR00725 family protein [Candidatus Marinimicrobia bacterium]|nr:TIGR00725 family protein [Candidatus Neomarinimicrobiota bacterium]|tara:strand:+ start:14898 stop:15215 length:318 start_codon:yes stop_codon:yes gene_type:complete